MSKLAILDGEKINNDKDFNVNPWPIIEEEDINEVIKVLREKDFFGVNNERIMKFEKEFAKSVGTKYGLAVNSGTAALHIAVAAAGVGPGDEVIIPALTFVASASCVLHHNGIPIFVDIDQSTYNLDPKLIEEKITEKTKAIIAVHFQGLCADMDEIIKIARKYNIKVIEDSSQAYGSEYKNKMAGGIGDMAGTSLMRYKNLAFCGEGGIFTTNDEDLRDKADMVRMFGEVLRKGRKRQYNAYVMGWNYRANVIQIAFGNSQLKRVKQYTKQRSENGKWLNEQLSKIGYVEPPYIPKGYLHTYHLYRIRVKPEEFGISNDEKGKFRLALMNALNAEGIYASEYQNYPVPGQAVFQIKNGYGKGCPWTCKYSNAKNIKYDIYEYPKTLDVIDTTFILDGACLPSQKNEYREMIVSAFDKIKNNKDEFVKYMNSLGEYIPPYKQAIRLY